MKQHSHSYKSYPNWRERESRMLIWASAAGGFAATLVGVVIWLISRHTGY
jgi:hypothetical protein